MDLLTVLGSGAVEVSADGLDGLLSTGILVTSESLCVGLYSAAALGILPWAVPVAFDAVWDVCVSGVGVVEVQFVAADAFVDISAVVGTGFIRLVKTRTKPEKHDFQRSAV